MENGKLYEDLSGVAPDVAQECLRAKRTREATVTANNNIEYMSISKGNKTTEYATVAQRVVAFRFIYPNGGISTKIISQTDTDVIVRAEIYDERGSLIATGIASENKNIGPVNKTSLIENAETSAVGRALGFLAIGTKNGIASAEEMQKVAQYTDERDALHKCDRCGRRINDTEDKAGKIWTADEIAEMTLKAYGHVVCLRCIREIKETKTEAET